MEWPGWNTAGLFIPLVMDSSRIPILRAKEKADPDPDLFVTRNNRRRLARRKDNIKARNGSIRRRIHSIIDAFPQMPIHLAEKNTLVFLSFCQAHPIDPTDQNTPERADETLISLIFIQLSQRHTSLSHTTSASSINLPWPVQRPPKV